MYIVEDRLSPALSTYASRQRVKRTLLTYWPKTYDGADQVFADLVYYTGGQVNTSAAYKKIYTLLNIKVSDLQAESYEGVASAWLRFKRFTTSYTITTDEVSTYIDNTISIGEWFTASLNYNPASLTIPAGLSDEELIAMCRDGHPDIWFGNEDEEAAIGMALIDTEDVMFEKEFSVGQRTIADKTSKQYTLDTAYTGGVARYIVSINIDMRFRRIKVTTDPLCDTLIDLIVTKVGVIDDYAGVVLVTPNSTIMSGTDVFKLSRFSAINEQLLTMYDTMVEIIPGQLNSATGKIKISGIEAMSGKDAYDFLSDHVTSGFSKKKVKWWKKALNIIIQVVALVIAIVTAPTTGGASLAAWATWAATSSIVIMIAMAAQMALAALYRATGDANAAAMVAGSMKFLGTISTILGIISIYAAFKTAIQKEMIKEAAKEMSKELATAAVKEGLVDLTSSAVMSAIKSMVLSGIKSSTSNIMQSAVKLVSVGMNLYREYIDPLPQEINDMKRELDEQERELADYSSGDSIKKSNMFLDGQYANPYDMNEYMHNIPYLMTQGKIVNSFNKYYS